jgi:IPT/TIG domain
MRFAIVAVAVVLAACSANDDIPSPVLASATPSSANVGTIVTLSGSYLCQQPEGSDDSDPLACAHTGAVMFGVTPANVTQYTDSSITALVPDMPAGDAQVSVATGGRETNSIDFTVE